jgi:hypothetical protein
MNLKLEAGDELLGPVLYELYLFPGLQFPYSLFECILIVYVWCHLSEIIYFFV